MDPSNFPFFSLAMRTKTTKLRKTRNQHQFTLKSSQTPTHNAPTTTNNPLQNPHLPRRRNHGHHPLHLKQRMERRVTSLCLGRATIRRGTLEPLHEIPTNTFSSRFGTRPSRQAITTSRKS